MATTSQESLRIWLLENCCHSCNNVDKKSTKERHCLDRDDASWDVGADAMLVSERPQLVGGATALWCGFGESAPILRRHQLRWGFDAVPNGQHHRQQNDIGSTQSRHLLIRELEAGAWRRSAVASERGRGRSRRELTRERVIGMGGSTKSGSRNHGHPLHVAVYLPIEFRVEVHNLTAD